MCTYKDYIRQYASQHESFSKSDLWEWLKETEQNSFDTLSHMLTQMVKAGELCRISQGKYSLATEHKQAFRAVLNDKEMEISSKLKQRFPFATFCIYSGKSLSPLQHHLSENNITFIETERYAVESVFEYLKSEGYTVWQNPDSDFIYKYVDLKSDSLIVKPLVTEAPTEEIDGVVVPTLEKLLVDIEKDPCFDYLRGTESSRMYDTAKGTYNINLTRLKRYAQRRGLKNLSGSPL